MATGKNLTNYDSDVLLTGSAYADTVYNGGDNVTISAGKGNDEIFNLSADFSKGGDSLKIDGGAGNDSINNKESNVLINGGKGNDTIDNERQIIKHSEEQEYETITSDNVTIDGGTGNDHIDNEDGQNVLFVYNSGDGKDVIEGFNAKSTLSIGGAKYTSAMSGDDLIFTVGKGKITLQGAATLSTVNIIGDEVSTLKTVTNATKSPVTLDAAIKSVDASKRTKAVQITGNKLANSIVGGKSNDTLAGGKGSDTFIYDAGDGKDIIYGFGNNDLLQITGGNVTASYSKSKNSVAFKVGKTSNAITLRDFGTTTTFHVNDTTYQLSGGKLTAK